MIIFTPDKIDVKSILSNPEGFTYNTANTSLAAQISEKFGANKCSKHPDYINEMLVHFKEGENLMTVISCCCDEFRAKLELLSENKNPF